MWTRWLIVLNSGLGNNVLAGPVLAGLESVHADLRYDVVALPTGLDVITGELGLRGWESVLPVRWRRFAPIDQSDMLAHIELNAVEVVVNLRRQERSADSDYIAFRRRAHARGVECWDLHELGRQDAPTHITTQVRRLLRLHGIELPAADERWLAHHRSAPRRDVVGLFVGASVGVKRWTVCRWAETAMALAYELGVRIELAAGPSAAERRLLAAVAAEMGADSAATVKVDSIRGLIDWVAGVGVLVSGDTAAAHLAAAIGTPVLSLHFSTLADIWRPGPGAHTAVALQSPIGASCRLMQSNGTCKRTYLGCFAPCRGAVAPSAVVAAVDRLLDAG
jgi:ADP-heptose:LPS heptosyltransferase